MKPMIPRNSSRQHDSMVFGKVLHKLYHSLNIITAKSMSWLPMTVAMDSINTGNRFNAHFVFVCLVPGLKTILLERSFDCFQPPFPNPMEEEECCSTYLLCGYNSCEFLKWLIIYNLQSQMHVGSLTSLLCYGR